MSRISLAGQSNTSLAASEEATSVHRICQLPEKGWERLWLWGTERINPIVVKEIRQSLKSRQFSISFGLTLIAAVTWTLIAVSLMVPRIYYMPAGLQLLTGFFCILQFPLMIIIPFSAFRSLAMESEDGTFELLSISALSAWQIIFGKMTSAVVQIVLYLSALAPCIVLTYLMRGVSLFSILFALAIVVAFSVAETAIALLLAAIARSRLLQGAVTILFLCGLIFVFFAWTSAIFSGFLGEVGNPPKEIYLVIFGFATVILVAIDLVLRAAAAAIDFPSENHSTPLRKRFLVLIGLILFWSTFAVVGSRTTEFAIVFLCCAFAVCMFVSALMCGELGIISPRARRTLPYTFAGRVLTTWFYPGAGMGYIFMVCLFGALVITMYITELYYSMSLQLIMNRTSIQYIGYLLLCYLAIYAGITRLIMLPVAKHVPARMLVSFAMMVVIMLVAHMVPLIIVYALNDYREFDYDWHQAANIFWTCGEATTQMSISVEVSLVLLTLAALTFFGLNLMVSTRDVMLVRIDVPERVKSETQLAQTKPVPDIFAE